MVLDSEGEGGKVVDVDFAVVAVAVEFEVLEEGLGDARLPSQLLNVAEGELVVEGGWKWAEFHGTPFFILHSQI